MKPVLICGNWKSNKTTREAAEWVEKFKQQATNGIAQNVTGIIAPSFPLLSFFKQKITEHNLPLQLAAQDVSPFPFGSYTGAVAALQVKEFAQWVIIGHSERRKYFKEDDQLLANKVDEAKTAGLSIIYCVSGVDTLIPEGVDVVAYEPVAAIGTGQAENPSVANEIIAALKLKSKCSVGIYGGSVTTENVESYISQTAIDGVLPGKASLDPVMFAQLIQHAST